MRIQVIRICEQYAITELTDTVERDADEIARWFFVLGTTPVGSVLFETRDRIQLAADARAAAREHCLTETTKGPRGPSRFDSRCSG
jgi:hypothetical protein